MKKSKIVVMGGGTGLPVLLSSLRKSQTDITAIVTVADDGGSSGILRECLDCPPPGDLRNVLVALSEMPKFYENLFQYRFKKNSGYFTDHAIGNMIIAATAQMQGSMYKAIQMLGKIMHIDGSVYPASEDPLILNAVFSDGTKISGESKIVKQLGQIDYVYLTNAVDDSKVKASRRVVQAILEADMVVLGPGSLFTSVLPNLLIPEISQAIKQTFAEVIYVCNLMTQRGETEFFTDADHLHVLHRHLKDKFVDVVLVNCEPILEKDVNLKNYDEYLVQVVHDFSGLCAEGVHVVSNNFLKIHDGGVFHDGDLLVVELLRLLSNRKVREKNFFGRKHGERVIL